MPTNNSYSPLSGRDPYALNPASQARLAANGNFPDTVEDLDVPPSYDEINVTGTGTDVR